jgi:hypothetical protein
MQDVNGFPYFEVQFNKEGAVHDEREIADLTDFLTQGKASDVFVISHGWNNDMDEARRLYRDFFERMREVLDSGNTANASSRKYAILGVLWPSKKFAEKELIPSGAAGAESPISDNFLKEQLDELKAVFTTPNGQEALENAKALVSKLEDSPKARTEFVDLVRSLLSAKAVNNEDASKEFFKLPGEEVIKRLSKPIPIVTPKTPTGGATRIGSVTPAGGGAAGITQFFSGIKSGALNFLNCATYYEMKERAGTVGADGLNPLLRRIREQKPGLKIHLIGHSFGGRLVTAAAAGPEDQPALKPDTMTLLQAAFSHYGFADHYDGTNNGFFRRVVADKRVSGPILITCTKNDRAVGKLYPIASLVAGQVAAELGDKNDKFGGIGRNGAQKTPEASDGSLLEAGSAYQFQAGKLHNLNADAQIMDHSDICKREIAYAVLKAVEMT